MNNQLSAMENERNVPIQTHHDLRNLAHHFWNMLDFSHHNELTNMEPKIEVTENKNNITVTAEMPGIAADNMDVEISADGYLTISGEKKHQTEQKEKGNYFSEISYGMVRRSIPLPWDLEFKQAKADYNDGILTVNIPKTAVEQTKKQKISINKKTKTTKTKAKTKK